MRRLLWRVRGTRLHRRRTPVDPCASRFQTLRHPRTGSAQAASGSVRPRTKKSRPISRVLSWTAIPLAGVSPRRSSDLPGSRAGRTWPLSRPASLFGLAPGGVCRAVVCCHRRGALLPHHFTLAGVPKDAWAVYFLLHFPWAHAPQALPGTVPWEPGLSSTRSSRAATAWPTPARTIGDSSARLKSDLQLAAGPQLPCPLSFRASR